MTSPLASPDSFDVVGERKNGGVDLVISCSGPLDGTESTVQRLHEKLLAYIQAATHPNFFQAYPAAKRGPTKILISCAFAVSNEAQSVIGEAIAIAETHGIEILLVPAVGTIQ